MKRKVKTLAVSGVSDYDRAVVRSMVNKVHAAVSYRRVCSMVAGRKYPWRTKLPTRWHRIPKELRKDILHLAVEHHARNRRLYFKVLRGGF